MNLTQTLDHPKSAIDSSYAESCIAERNTDIAVVLIPPDDFNLKGDALHESQRVNAPGAEIQNSPVLLSYALQKNGSSETDVYSTIYTCVLAADSINSNANAKGIYLSPKPINSPQAIPQTHKEEKNLLVNDCIILLQQKPVDKHLYFGADGLLYSHIPGLPDLN